MVFKHSSLKQFIKVPRWREKKVRSFKQKESNSYVFIKNIVGTRPLIAKLHGVHTPSKYFHQSPSTELSKTNTHIVPWYSLK